MSEVTKWFNKAEELMNEVGRLRCITNKIKQRQDDLEAENKRLRDYIMKLRPKHDHDHSYFHDDCRLCQIEKRRFAKTERVLNGE